MEIFYAQIRTFVILNSARRAGSGQQQSWNEQVGSWQGMQDL